MTTSGRAYVVRDDTGGAVPGNVDRLFPYTLRGLTEALDEARYRSYAGPPQVVTVVGGRGSRVIRRYANGREVPVTEDRA